MKRWKIELADNKILNMYYSTIDEAWEHWTEAMNITENTDKSYLEYLDKIKVKNEHTFLDCRKREVWKIPRNAGFILFRPYTADGEYIDGCEYQRWDNIGTITPIGWTIASPKEFYEDFILTTETTVKYNRRDPRVTPKEIKKIKAKKFYNKENITCWIDEDGYFYFAWKDGLPTKKDREEYNLFNGNKEAVYATWGKDYGRQGKWFDSIEVFKKFFEKEKANFPASHGTLYYEIKKRGYKKAAPDDRKVIFKLPYFNLDKEYELSMRETANQKAVIPQLAKSWADEMNGIKHFGNPYKNLDWIEKLIDKYLLSKAV